MSDGRSHTGPHPDAHTQADAGAPPPSGRLLGVVTIVSTLAGWTSIPLFLRFLTKDVDAWTANGWRYGVSALLWLPVLLLGWRRGTLPKGLWRAAMMPSIWNVPGQVLFGLAPYYVEPGLMTFSMRLQIVFLFTGAALLFPAERRVIRSRWFLIGIAMVLGGTLATVALEPGGLGGGSGVGVAMAIGAGLFYACYALSVRRTMMGIGPLVAFAAVNQLTGVALVALMLAFGHDLKTGAWDAGLSALSLGPGKFWLLVLSAIVGIGLGHTFYFLSIKRLGLAVSTAVVQLQPVTVSLASWAIFAEALTPLQWVTGLLALSGAGVVLVAQHRLAARPPAGAGAAAVQNETGPGRVPGTRDGQS
ncbi:MAG: DMT family transporter [Planctomycetota bacterium]|nr:DMT family transporter [Planctomycetota bacterium]